MLLNRRRFCLLAACGLPTAVMGQSTASTGRRAPTGESRRYYGGFRVGLQSWTYRKLSLGQAMAKAASLELKYFEPSPAHADLTVESTDGLRQIRARLLDAGLSASSYGVVSFPGKDGRGNLEKVFRHAQEFGVRTLVVDPHPKLLEEIDRLANRYRVDVAIRNQFMAAGQSEYSTAQGLLSAIKGRSERFGAAIDTGNLLSSGQDPVQAIESLKDRVWDVHLKDVSKPGVSCALGAGKLDLPGLLAALRKQEYDGPVMVEYEETPDDPDPAVMASFDYLKKVTGGK
jgi:sugar phosphate isomerase/epimerase